MSVFAMLAVAPIDAATVFLPARSFTASAFLAATSLDTQGFSTNQMTVILVAGIAMVVAIIVVFGLYLAKRRAEALESAATLMGFSFERDGATLRAQLDGNLHLLKLGSSKKLNNVMRGSSSAGEITLFEYSYTEGGGQQQGRTARPLPLFTFQIILCPNSNWAPNTGGIKSEKCLDTS